jgi:hypothetical protein
MTNGHAFFVAVAGSVPLCTSGVGDGFQLNVSTESGQKTKEDRDQKRHGVMHARFP